MKIAREKISASREIADSGRRTGDPFAIGIAQRVFAVDRGDHEPADRRIVCRRDLGIGVVGGFHLHRHVRLPGAEPDVAHQHIFDRKNVRYPRDKLAWLCVGVQWIQLQRPFPSASAWADTI